MLWFSFCTVIYLNIEIHRNTSLLNLNVLKHKLLILIAFVAEKFGVIKHIYLALLLNAVTPRSIGLTLAIIVKLNT